MPSSPLDPRSSGSIAVHAPLPRLLPAALALFLTLGCAKDGERPEAPLDRLHFPAWLATTTAEGFADTLLVVNLDQNLAFTGGSVVSVNTAVAAPPEGGLPLPSMAGQLLAVDKARATAEGCTAGDDFQAFALVAGRTEDRLFRFPLAGALADQRLGVIDLGISGASRPFGLGLTCAQDGKMRVWASYQRGRQGNGYVARVDMSTTPPGVVAVNVGKGAPRSFAYDRDRDRLYVSAKESAGHAHVRWITVGEGCVKADNGVQDEREGGCHVDPGFDLSATLAGAEPNEIALSTGTAPCTAGIYAGRADCRRMYISTRMYDADLERALRERPSGDVGGKLVVLELPESSTLGGPDPQWIHSPDIGVGAGAMAVIPRPGRPDLVVVAAIEDDLVWIYDDEVGALVKVFGRDPRTGVPVLGHAPAGLATRALSGGIVRVFVSSYQDDWVSAIDVDTNAPASAYVVRAGPDPKDVTQPILHLGVTP